MAPIRCVWRPERKLIFFLFSNCCSWHSLHGPFGAGIGNARTTVWNGFEDAATAPADCERT
jgi:hypothetical protein